MTTRDILLLITSKCDDLTLEKLSHTTLWNTIKLFSSDQHFWYLRVQHLVRLEVLPIPITSVVWKEVYRILEPVIDSKNPLLEVQTNNHLVIKILLELGHNPTENDNRVLYKAVMNGYTDTIKLLLSDSRVIPTHQPPGCNLLKRAIIQKKVEVVNLLLLDGRIEPTNIMSLACNCEEPKILELLLADKRVDPNEDDNNGLYQACYVRNVAALRLLLKDGRVDPACNNNKGLLAACSNGHRNIVEILLSCPTVIPTADCLNAAVEGGYIRTTKLILSRRLEPNQYTILCAIKSRNCKLVSLLLQYEQEPLDRVLVNACDISTSEVIKLLLANKNVVDPSSNNNEAIRVAICNGRRGITNLLIQDWRIDLDKLVKDLDLYDLINTLMDYIEKNITGLCMHVSEKPPASYQSLARLLVFRRPTHCEIVQWMARHSSSELSGAARSFLLNEQVDIHCDLSVAYRGFLMSHTLGTDLTLLRTRLEELGASERSINLSCGLVAAHTGTTVEHQVMILVRACRLLGTD